MAPFLDGLLRNSYSIWTNKSAVVSNSHYIKFISPKKESNDVNKNSWRGAVGQTYNRKGLQLWVFLMPGTRGLHTFLESFPPQSEREKIEMEPFFLVAGIYSYKPFISVCYIDLQH